jgi:hypothetical protein
MALYHFTDVVQSASGAALVGWRVQIVTPNTDTVVPIYSDISSTPIITASGIANTAVSDAAGNYGFYVPEGAYDIMFYNSAGVFQRRLEDKSMFGDGASVAAAQSAATLAGHYANDNVNSDVPGGSAGDRGAKYYATQAAASAGGAAQPVIPGFNSLTQHNPNLAVSVVQGVYVNKSTGAVVSLAGLETFSGPCVAGTTIRFNRTTPFNSAGLAYFTAANAYISGGDYTAFADSVVPANATNFKISLSYPAFYDQTGTADPAPTFMAWDTMQPIPYDYQAPGYVDPYQSSKRANAVVRSHRPAWDYYDVDTTIKDAAITAAGAVTLGAGLGLDLLPLTPCEYGVPVYFSHTWTPGNPAYGFAWYDHSGTYIGGSGAQVTANLSGTSMTVTAQSGSYSRLCIGGPLSGTGIGAGVYITAGPADGGLGVYTLSASVTTGIGVTVQQLGYLANAPIYPIKGAGFFRTCLLSTDRYRLRISNSPFASTNDLRGVVGFADVKARYPLRGKVGAILGDSIAYSIKTADQRFLYQIERGTRSYVAMSRPVPGWATSAILGDTVAAGYTALRGATGSLVSGNVAGLDWLLSNAGTNDFGGNRPIGVLGDTAASNTFYGDLYDIYVNKLQTWNPTMRVILMTPLRRFDGSAGDYLNGNPTQATSPTQPLSAYADAILAFARRWDFPVIDLFYNGKCGFNSVNYLTFYDNLDKLHPVGGGYDRIIPWLVNELNAKVAG